MRICKVVFAIWVAVWLVFFSQQVLWGRKLINECPHLIQSNTEQRRAEAYGEDYYAFLRFCQANLPHNTRFQLVGPPEWSVDRVRAHYFLYPSLVSEKPEFILVYKTPTFQAKKATQIATLSRESYVLRVDQ
jgi:hypothetical protein